MHDDSTGNFRGYWKDAANVEAELRKFMDTHGITDRMPSYTELREAGAYTLLSALSKHRGMGTFAKRLGYVTFPYQCFSSSLMRHLILTAASTAGGCVQTVRLGIKWACIYNWRSCVKRVEAE